MTIFLAPLLGQSRNRDAHDLAVIRGVEPDVGGHDRLLDRPDLAGVVGLRHEHRRLGDCHVGDLVDRRRSAVVVDVDGLEQRRTGAARAQSLEFFVQMIRTTFHLFLDFEEELLHHHLRGNCSGREHGPKKTLLTKISRTAWAGQRSNGTAHSAAKLSHR